MEETVSDAYGEPISAGATPHAGELTVQFDKAVDLARIEGLLRQARERGGGSPETVSTLNLVAIFFSAAQYEKAREALEVAGTLHPCRLVAVIADQGIEQESLTARLSVVRSGGTITMERVVLSATGRAVRHLESAMMGLLRADLPMVVVWGGRTQGDLLLRVVESADRIVTDSGDLREHRGTVRRARVVCAGAIGAEGLLLLGWMQSRIKRLEVEIRAEGEAEEEKTSASTPVPRAARLGLGHVKLLEFVAPPATFTLVREKDVLISQVKGDDDGFCAHRVRLPPEMPGRLLALELKLLSGRDELYAQAVQAAAKLLATRT
ncbi:MAG: hypothetical protein E6J66_14465 [Deltaproteobacteria bacterium]|nr:MAG: hypothetical protein E6J66_14465 [Deltaproteobacteria bacterium]